MKKSIIAAGAASVALAAMPIVGAFAANIDVNDVITATLNPGCTVSSVADNNVNITLVPGSIVTTPAAASVSVVCNNSSWGIKAAGTGAENHTTELYDATGDNAIATGTATSGTSNWAFRVESLSGVQNTGPEGAPNATIDANADPDSDPETQDGYNYGEFSAIPASATTIVKGAAAANITMNTQYRVFTVTTQAGGIYNGQVTYTVVENLN